MKSFTWYTSYSSDVNEKQYVGEPIMRSDGCDRTASCMANAAAKIFFAFSR